MLDSLAVFCLEIRLQIDKTHCYWSVLPAEIPHTCILRHVLKPETPKRNHRNVNETTETAETTETPERNHRNTETKPPKHRNGSNETSETTETPKRNHRKNYKNLNKTIATASIAPPLLNSGRIVMSNDLSNRFLWFSCFSCSFITIFAVSQTWKEWNQKILLFSHLQLKVIWCCQTFVNVYSGAKSRMSGKFWGLKRDFNLVSATWVQNADVTRMIP